MFKILVVEDDTELRSLFCRVLMKNGYQTFRAGDGEEALEVLDHEYVDLILCDVMMPRMDGFELTRELRAAGMTMPVLMITAKDAFGDKREGFDAGADDYMVKPIDVNEMVLRVGALLRRSKSASSRKLTVGNTTLDYDTLTVRTPEGETTLPQKEFQLLYKLLSDPGHIFTRLQIMDDIWGMDSETDAHTVDVHINRLRDRFRGSDSFEIVTVRGLGYKAVRKA
ncbi:MAG: response regulator transcription factor [Clostridiaceae bacterium]|nr:response regulator transcription factor [Clostridiales bacterium]MDD6876392.1 response regulator transcription factor [Clostridiaceae bacterium]MDY3071998.1 response regulator transcription factor [Eubacteriales bacterium]MDY3287333.1 response regulator transcription factor [Eubacteriales bacterium]